ncbi:helix-turn-helix domain-containing protein [Streptomyces sp. NPDC046685]|uniref:helix-turn-helix domain-containing protein n=1 Tax=Streptomyces sp. NPDC046685 TaxID=3157202 RepID=UPI0034093AA9
MSLDPILWALKDAPVADVNEFAVLVTLAETADEDGCDAFPSVPTMASYAKISTRTVQRCLAALEERQLIAEGNQDAAKYIPAHKRPTVYDLLIPYAWFSNIERTNDFRARRGRPPITPADRPSIAPAPPKKARTDKGKPRKANDTPPAATGDPAPDRTAVEDDGEGRLVVTPVENRETGVTTSHPVTDSPARGDYKSEQGRLEVTQTSPVNHPDDPRRPSVGSSGAPAGLAEGGTDGEQVDVKGQKAGARTLERTPGVELLQGLGFERPELLLTGKVLTDQARMVDGMLLEGWSRDHILTELLRPLPPQTRSVGAVISRRLRDMLSTPVPRPTRMPSPRNPEAAEGYWESYEQDKRGGTFSPDAWSADQDPDAFVRRRTRWADCAECKDPIITATGTDRCGKCLGWPCCPLCTRLVRPGSCCEKCDVAPEEIQFEQCEVHGDRFVAGTACFQC